MKGKLFLSEKDLKSNSATANSLITKLQLDQSTKTDQIKALKAQYIEERKEYERVKLELADA